jgi:adenylate cyclase
VRANLLTRHLPAKIFGYALGVLLTVGAGVLLTRMGGAPERVSYDIPFLVQKRIPDELVMVYFDAQVKRTLAQPVDQPLNRRFFARLLERLTRDRARLVLFDVLLDQPSPEPGVDEAFARLMREQGRVVLVAESVKQLQGNFLIDATLPPLQIFQQAAAGYGLANVKPDEDFSIRKIDTGVGITPSASLVAARLLTGREIPRVENAWLNYYCSPGGVNGLNTVSLDSAIEDHFPTGYFRDKIVVIGARPEASVAGADREEFGNPYSNLGDAPRSSGAAVHALSTVNLTRGDWLRRLTFRQESLIAIAWGVLVCLLLMRLNPWVAIGAALLAGLLFAAVAGYVQLRSHVWFAWVVPAGFQTAVALVWAVGYVYSVESRRRRKLRRAFAAYVSPYMADRIANSDFDLSPGGKEVEATILFTDLEGFTQLSESLSPAELSRILIAYFNQTTRGIFDQDGMVIKFIGDAVLAAWGAPLPEPKPEERAVLAALAIRAATAQEIEGLMLRTRIGINTGMVLAGNFGSDTRIEYTVLGDAINIGQRLEQLNKQLGTEILISGITRSRLSNRIQVRKLGRFVVPGKTAPVEVWEVLGQSEPGSLAPAWVDTFAEALDRFGKADFVAASDLFAKVTERRGGKDGPSEFYCDHIRHLPGNVAASDWDGIIRLGSK